jgi:hypothetical protein
MFICRNVEARHSPVHDCESTFWLTIWVIAFIAKKVTKNEALKAELVTPIRLLRPTKWNFESSADGKRSLVGTILSGDPWALPSPFHPFIPLLKQMAQEVKKNDNLSNSRKDYTFTKEQIRNCIAHYMAAIDNNPLTQDDWTYIDEAKPALVEDDEEFIDL